MMASNSTDNNNSALMKKRERTQNWALEEKQLLLHLCEKNIKYIENKKADSQTSNLKNVAWRNIHKEFMNTFGSDRDCNRLKEQWRRMKGWARSEILEQRGKDWKRPSALSEHVWRVMQLSHMYQKEDHQQMSSEDEEFRLLKKEEALGRVEGEDERHQLTNGKRDGSANKWEGELDHTSLCEVQIKEESVSEDGSNYLYNSYSIPKHSITIERCEDVRKNSLTPNASETIQNGSKSLISAERSDNAADLSTTSNNQEYVSTTTRFRRKRARNNSFVCDTEPLDFSNTYDDEFKQYKQKEIAKRLQILDEELLTAKIKRETAEINRRIAEEKLKEVLHHNADNFVQ